MLAPNIKYLRRSIGITQDELASRLGIKRSAIGSYEEGRAMPKPELLVNLAKIFQITVDSLLTMEFSDNHKQELVVASSSTKVLSVVVTPDNKELIAVVPVKAAAGYLNGLSDPEYIGQLPVFSMPVPELSPDRTYRVFQIRGDSMLPVSPGSYLFCDYVECPDDIKDGKTYIIITKEEGIVYKRVFNQIDLDGSLLLKSDNSEYQPYKVDVGQILELWRVIGYLSFELPAPDLFALQRISAMLSRPI